MNADAKIDAMFGKKASVALDHFILYLDRAAHGVNHATKFDDAAVSGALHNAAVMDRNGGVHQIATQCSQACQRSIFVGAGQPAVSNYVRDQNSGEFPASGQD